MSKKVDDKYFYNDEEEALEEEEEDRKCPPQLVPSLKPDADYSLGAEAVDTAVPQKPEAVAIEEAVLFDEEEEIKGRANEHVFAASSDDRNTESHRAFGGQPNYSLDGEAVDTQGQPCPNATEQRRHHIQNRIFPGAFREGGPDIEEGYEDDGLTITIEEESEEQAPAATRQKSIDPVSAELVNVVEEQRRLQEQIDQALERERQRAVVAEVVPVNDGDLPQSDAHKFGTRKRDWLVIGTILLIVVAITTALALTLPPKPSHCERDGYFGPNCDLEYLSCSAPETALIGNGRCDGKPYNTEECGWDGGDCCAPGDPRPICKVPRYPNCSVPDPASTTYIGDGTCDGLPYNTEECGWDGGDCCAPGYFGPNCTLYYPNCHAPIPKFIGNGVCDFGSYSTEECGWDGNDCCALGYFGPSCTLNYPNCQAPIPRKIGDGRCDSKHYNTEECGWDGGDCVHCNAGYFGLKCDLYYPNCNVSHPGLIGNGVCDYQYNTTECGWEGGDCRPCDDGYFGPNCHLHYPNCSVPYPELIGDGECHDGAEICDNMMGDDCYTFIANTSECGWEGGDCLPSCGDGYFGLNCDLYYPNCSVPILEWIGDGWCDGLPYNIEECGWDGGDCCDPGYFGPNCDLYFPNCNVSLTEYIDDGSCDIRMEVCGENGCQAVMGNTEECGWEGGDCVHCDDGYFGPDCNITGYPNCSVDYPAWIGDGICDGDAYDTEECGWDGGDCVHCNASYFGPNCTLYYPNCSATYEEAWTIGDGYCDDLYNTTECGWEGGDCLPCNTSYFGFNCDLYYPNCSIPYPESESIGDGFCDGLYNTTECGWEGGDCIPCSDGYFGFDCDLYYPNCSVPIPEYIGDGACDGEPFDSEECGWDGGDCPH